MSTRMYRWGVTEHTDPVAEIADALARLRMAGRPGGPPWAGRGPWDVGPHGGPHHGHEHHPHPPHGGPLGRGIARLRLLEALARAGAPQSVGALAEALGVDQPRASRLVQAAVQMGLARREADPADARRTLVALTDEGRVIVDRSRGARAGAVEQALDGFTPAERAQLAALLTRLADAWPR